MWILESSSELFQGRRMWLKPGKSYLFGRVKKDGVRFAIEHKTISRKHFIIQVDDVRSEDVGNIHVRTTLTIEDQNSKAGTHVNGEHIKGSSKELKKEENYIKPGSLPEDLVIKWHPHVLTFSLLKKEIKAGLLKSKQERVRDLDIKVVSEYVVGQTTHLVVNKRNTPKGLQALIDGVPLVSESYLDALEYATTPSDLNEEENLSPLEQDFDLAWPVPHDHLPPPGREPTLRPADFYMPDVGRRTVFENFTFVFLDETQYDNLLPPITTGHGKALFHKLVANETTVEELVTFLRNAAGQKGFGDAQREVDKGGVLLVRFKGVTGSEDWTNALINETSLKLDQRAIDQGEFLDAILAKDAMLLRQSVPYESNGDAAASFSATKEATTTEPHPPRILSSSHSPSINGRATASALQPPGQTRREVDNRDNASRRASDSSTRESDKAQQSTTGDTQTIARRARFMVPKKSKAFDFDDDFDPAMVVPYQEDDEEETPYQNGQASSSEAGDGMDRIEEEVSSSKKRRRSPSREASAGFGDEMDDLLPAAAAVKRRKLAEKSRNGTSATIDKADSTPAQLKKPKQEKEINVREVARAQRAAEDEQAKREQQDAEEEYRIEPGQKLPIYDVETVFINLPERKRTSNEGEQEVAEHWNPSWNGRKNFKGFRRARDKASREARADTPRRNHTKVLVPMVDAKLSTYGIGDQYWDKSQEEKDREREKRRRTSQRTTQSQSDRSRLSRNQRSQTTPGSDEEDATGTNGNVVQTSAEILRLQQEAAEIMDHGVDIEEPRQTRASETQTQSTSRAQGIRDGKRAANSVGRAGAAKKQKTLPVTVIHGDDSDDSDDMKFKFGSRKRGNGRT